jgi:SAM-dependent methyltransferase
MNWKIKSAIRHGLLTLPGGVSLYRRLTSEWLGTQHGMAAKWFRVFPAHIRVLEEKFGNGARSVPLWCFDSGTTPAAGFAQAIVSDEPGLLTDRWDRLSNRYLPHARSQVEENGSKLANLSRAPMGRLDEVRAKLRDASGSVDALSALGQTFVPRHEAATEAPWRGTIGLIYSAGSFEHYTPEEVARHLGLMKDALRPGGVLSHVVDHRDHRWHADKSIPPFLHLTLGTGDYQRRFGNPLDYHNRWLKSRWITELEKHGFEVECKIIFRHETGQKRLSRQELDPAFHDASDDDLDCLVTHFIARKTG